MKVIDSEGLILGRLATQTAKMLLEGEEVVILNAEKAVVSGSPRMIMKEYYKKWETYIAGPADRGFWDEQYQEEQRTSYLKAKQSK